MRLLFAGGGTGGHLFPAVALAQLFLQQEPKGSVQFVGTQRGLEQRLLPDLGLPLATVDMVGVVGSGWRGKLEMLPKLLKSMLQSRKILGDFKPDLVIGVGGYASVPVLLMAKLARIPYVIHEQNAIPGLSNKLLSRGAKRVFLSYDYDGSGFGSAPTVVTGNPLRFGLEGEARALPKPGKLLIFGGSRGAQAINQAVVEMLPTLAGWELKPEILHQTGDADFKQVQQAYTDAGFDPQQVVPFIDDMESAYCEASIVVCRAGATTLAEIVACGRPAILIPYPYAAANHQVANAKVLVASGAAKMLIQDDLTAERLAELIKQLWNNRQELKQLASCGRKLGATRATEKILNECRALLKLPQAEECMDVRKN